MAQSQTDRCADLDFQEADAKLSRTYKKELKFTNHDPADAQQRSDEEQAKVENAARAASSTRKERGSHIVIFSGKLPPIMIVAASPR
jgi:uncharacterized protein YecT (DUF1311 family)